MKNNRGITIITLLITIIVMIVLASISTYTGINMIEDTKESTAKDRLKVICNTVLKDDSFLNFEDTNLIELTQAEYDYMNLPKYNSNDYRITIQRTITDLTDGNQKIAYHLVQTNTKDSKKYEYDFDYTIYNEKYNYQASFDSTNGANRPIILPGMKPLMPDGLTPVEDVYQDHWYNYKNLPATFAKMEYEGRVYMWIPRFAYSIQNFYNNRKSTNVPSSAISIIFLRENTNYMENDEVMDAGYSVHPAFGSKYCGFWMEIKPRETKTTLTGSPLYQSSDQMHLMTNSECGAVLYLFHALGMDVSQIFEKDEYVAASLSEKRAFISSEDFVDVYPVISNNYKPGVLYGDVDGDGSVTEQDSVILEGFLSGGERICSFNSFRKF